MKKKRIIFLYFLIFLAFGCKKEKEDKRKFPNQISKISIENSIVENRKEIHSIKIDLSEVIEGEFKDFFNLKRVIYLDNRSLIGNLSIIKQYRKNILVLDKVNARQLYCYSSSGKLLWEYKSKGGAALDYQSIQDFVVNTTDMTVDVLDNKGYKIIKLDINSGEPIGYSKLGVYIDEMEWYDNNYLVYTGNLTVSDDLDYKLLKYNFNDGVVSKNLVLSDNRKKIQRAKFNSTSMGNSGEVFFIEELNDTIYSIKNDTLKTKYYIDFLEKSYPPELKDNYSLDAYQEIMERKPFVTGVDFVREKDGFLSFIFSYKGRFYTVFYDLKHKKSYIFSMLKNVKFSPGGYGQVFIQGYLKDGFISIIEPAMLVMVKRQMESNSGLKKFIKEERPELYKMMIETNEYSNPILLVYEFKMEKK